MKVSAFISGCARSIYDYGLNVLPAQEWLDILNFQSGELYPEIGLRGTKTGTIAALEAASDEYQLDMSGETGIENVKEVILIDSDGNRTPYDNWIYNKDTQILDLEPTTSKVPQTVPGDYTSYEVIYFRYLPEYAKTNLDIDLPSPKIAVLKNICIREALRRILNDHAKLDRYRTLVGRMNEYAMMAMIDRLSTEIELNKRKLVDTHPLRFY